MVAASFVRRWGRCAQNLSKSSFKSSCILIFGVAALKIWQNLFYNLFSFYRRMFLFCGCRYFVRQGLGGRCAQNLAKIFFKIFLFLLRRFFLFGVAATSCGRGGRCAQNLAKIFFKIFFLNSFLYCLFFWGGGKFFFKIFFYSHFFGRYTFLGRCAQNLAKSTLKSFTYNRRTFSISPLSYRSYHSENKPSGPKLISMPYG